MSPDDAPSLTAIKTSMKDASTRPLPLRLAIAEYDRTRPLINGTVQPEGIELTTASPEIAAFCNGPVYEQFDVAEMSFSLYVAARARGDKVIALPIFPLRMAVLAYVFCRDDAPYKHPSELIGKRIASIGYRYTVNLWLRGIFNDHYGLAPDQVTWVTGQEENAGFVLPKGIDVRVKPGRSPGDLLLSGEADAIIGPEAPDEYLNGDKRIRRLFADAQGEGVDYFRKTGIFPATHIVVMSEASWRARPWVAEPLVKAFTEAQRQADAFIYGNAKHNIHPDAVFFHEEERRLWGENPWPHGLKANRKLIETFVRYAHEQGYIGRRLSIDEMFAENTLHL
jgi:4,5-dihydroxyphthalate decarboxylase